MSDRATRGLRPVPMHTVLSHTCGVSYLLEGDYSWGGAIAVMAYMVLGIVALPMASGRAFAWVYGLRVVWAVESGPKPRRRRYRETRL